MNVLAVFAHPDDEVLGAGGALAKHAEAGDEIRIRILCSRDLGQQARDAADTLVGGAAWLLTQSFPDQKFDTLPLSEIIDLFPTPAGGWQEGDHNPDVIYTHHPGDLNQDHALTAQAVLTAFRPKPGEKPRTILACEVGSSTEWTFPQQFQPNYFVEILSAHLAKKIAALECYRSELHPSPHPRNRDGIITALKYRGQQAGVRYAEAFQLLRGGPF